MRSVRERLFVVGLVLLPFGQVSELLKKENPWRGFNSDEAIQFIVRVEEVPTARCSDWIDALVEEPRGAPVTGNWSDSLKAWGPWDKEDLEQILDCKRLPCLVKLDGAEVGQIAAAPDEVKSLKYLSLVQERANRYLKTGERKHYEFPGDPVDPWSYFEKNGLKTELKRPQIPELWVRRLNFASNEIRSIRQVLDRRIAVSKNRMEGHLWVRDIYTDHYFESWGEWGRVTCEKDPKNGRFSARVSLALFIELDQFKATDLFSRLARGRIRDAVQENGKVHLDQWFSRLKKKADNSKALSPSS